MRKTRRKVLPSEATVNRIQESKIWKMENEFYEFALAIFRRTKELTLVNGNDLSGGLTAKAIAKQRFFYDKIRPKLEKNGKNF